MGVKSGPLVLLDARVYDSLHPEKFSFSCIRIQDGLIEAFGDRESLVSMDTEVLDLDGKYVYPGFFDSHIHVRDLGSRDLKRTGWISLAGKTDSEETIGLLRSEANILRPGKWIVATGWAGPPSIVLDRSALDLVSVDHPIWVEHWGGHWGVANSAALQNAEIDAETLNPLGGFVEKDPDNHSTGVLRESAMELIKGVLPAFDDREVTKALSFGLDRLAQNGITGVRDMGSLSDPMADIAAYARLRELEKVLPQVQFFLRATEYEANLDALTHNRLQVGVKIFADGSIGARTALLAKPYTDDPGNFGLRITTPEAFQRLMLMLCNTEYELAVHAIGDQAVHEVIDAYRMHKRVQTVCNLKLSIEHAELLSDDSLSKLSGEQIRVSMQPIHLKDDAEFLLDRIGSTRMSYAFRWKELLDSGVELLFGSDAPYSSSVNPVDGIQYATRILSGSDYSSDPLPLQIAIRSYTRTKLAVGERADLAILDSPLRTSACGRSRVISTLVGGELVYSEF